MKIDGVTAVYFSPTGGSKKYSRLVAERFSRVFKEINLTDFNARSETFQFGHSDLVIIAAPVYYGRIPALEDNLFSNLRGENTPAIFMISYGGRDYEDALLEMKDICESRGFKGVSAGAFISPHTFSDLAGRGRPDAEDMAALEKFVNKTKQILFLAKNMENVSLEVPGKRLYRTFRKLPFAPVSDDKCVFCGLCARVCPVKAIPVYNFKETDKEKCVVCFDCVKRCPAGSRSIIEPEFMESFRLIEEEILKKRKNPELFYAEFK